LPVQQAVYEPLPLPDVASDGAWSPQIDVRELPDEYIVLVDLPGVDPKPFMSARRKTG
jgi:HSP20 family molecular chaperone IbpA